MYLYKLTWKDGSIEFSRGRNQAEAFHNLGYRRGALPALESIKLIRKTLRRKNNALLSNSES